jgi:hypothetical protein
MKHVKPPSTALIATFVALALASTGLAHAGAREQAKRLHDRLAGVPPSAAVLTQMETMVASGPAGALQAAAIAMQSPAFYSVVLKVKSSPKTDSAWQLDVDSGEHWYNPDRTFNPTQELVVDVDPSGAAGAIRWDWCAPFNDYKWEPMRNINIQQGYSLGFETEGSIVEEVKQDGLKAKILGKGEFDANRKVSSNYTITLYAWQMFVTGGYVASREQEGTRLVAYWLGREYWGRGIASAALREYLAQETTRPLHAYVAVGNVGSMRVLERCGFVRVGAAAAGADGGEEYFYRVTAWRVPAVPCSSNQSLM